MILLLYQVVKCAGGGRSGLGWGRGGKGTGLPQVLMNKAFSLYGQLEEKSF